jgi:hypothetical protein
VPSAASFEERTEPILPCCGQHHPRVVELELPIIGIQLLLLRWEEHQITVERQCREFDGNSIACDIHAAPTLVYQFLSPFFSDTNTS